jgi:hypothetical protein
MWIDAIGWVCSLLLVALLGFRLQTSEALIESRRGMGLWLLGELAASLSLLGHAYGLNRAMLLVSGFIAVTNVIGLAVLNRRARRTVLTLRAANDEGTAVRLRIMSQVLELENQRVLRIR